MLAYFLSTERPILHHMTFDLNSVTFDLDRVTLDHHPNGCNPCETIVNKN